MHDSTVGRIAGEFKLATDIWDLYSFQEPNIQETLWCPNTIVNGGYDLLGKLVAGQHVAPNYVYIEFANSPPPITFPSSIDVTQTVANYYATLGGTRDYLRLPLEITPRLDGSSVTFVSNRATFYSVSSDGIGNRATNPLTFSQNNGSVVYGIAIVYAQDPNDKTKDILFSRGYPEANLQKAKPVSGQVTMMWRVKFETLA